MTPPDWILPTLVGAILGWVLGLFSNPTWELLEDWTAWLRGDLWFSRLNRLMALGVTPTREDQQRLEDGVEGRKPPWIIRRVYRLWTRKKREVDPDLYLQDGDVAVVDWEEEPTVKGP